MKEGKSMTIEQALKGADNVKQNLLSNKIGSKEVNEAANVIEGLIRIIYWYDANQQRLVKTISKLVKRDKAMKKVLALYLKEGDEL